MRAIVVEQPGEEDVLQIGEAPSPVMGPNDVRIAIRAAGVNRADLLQRQGHYPPPPGASTIIGMECAGTILERGAGATQWQIGDRVMALMPGGGYAEDAVVDAGSVMRIPDGMSFEEAGALPEVFLTVYLNIFMLARAQPGETVLIHGGGSGIGTAATTLCKLAGMRVVVTAGSDEKCRRCLGHGADVAINYRTEDFVARSGGADVILDHLGALYLPRDLQALRLGGRVVVIGSMGGEKMIELDVSTLLMKRQQIIGSTLRGRSAAEKAAIVAAFLGRFGGDLEAGRIRPVVDRVYPLSEAGEAHRRMKSNAHFGKIVLRVQE